MIIGISGKIGAGKDEVGKIIQGLSINKNADYEYIEKFYINSNWKIKKFANTLKDIVCLLLNCTREQLEDREFKEKELGEEWWIISKPEIGMFIPYSEDSWAAHGDFEHNLIRLTPRLLLQLLGTECGRQIIHPNVWVNALMSKYEASVPYPAFKRLMGDITRKDKEFPSWIITDMRFPNELKAVKDRKNSLTLRIERPNNSLLKNEEHISETALDNEIFDEVIINDGTIENLINKVKTILIKHNIL